MQRSRSDLIVRRPTLAATLLAATLLADACGDGGAQTETFPLCAEDPGPAPLRRVTRFEYGRTISDLTGVAGVGRRPAAARRGDAGLRRHRRPRTASRPCTPPATWTSRKQAAAALAANAARLTAVAGCDPTAATRPASTSFIAGFGRRAWRRPLDTDELAAMQQLYTDTAEPGPVDGIAGVVAAMLQAPQFLYRPGADADGGDGSAAGTVRARDPAVVPADGRRAGRPAALRRGDAAASTPRTACWRRPIGCWQDPRAAELFVHVAQQWWELGNVADHRQGPQPVPHLDGRHARRARRGDAPVPRRRLAGEARPHDAADRAVHLRRRGSGGVLQPAGAGRQRVPARRRSIPRAPPAC